MFKRLSAALACGVLLLASPVLAPQARAEAPISWTTAAHPELGFKVDFPGDVLPFNMDSEVPATATSKGGKVVINMLLSVQGAEGAYAVMKMDMSQTDTNMVGADAAFDQVKGQMKGGEFISNTSVATASGPAHDVVLRKDGNLIRARMFFQTKVIYMVMVMRKKDDLEALKDADAEHFLGSFALIGS